MSVFQLLVNILIAVLACVFISMVFSYVDVALEGLIVFVLCAIAIVVTFAYNAAGRLNLP